MTVYTVTTIKEIRQTWNVLANNQKEAIAKVHNAADDTALLAVDSKTSEFVTKRTKATANPSLADKLIPKIEEYLKLIEESRSADTDKKE